MVKKTVAIVLEIIPIASAITFFTLFFSPYDSQLVRTIINITVAPALLGFVFFFIGRALVKKDKAVLILGIFDWLATVSVIGFYILAILSIGM
ncbi:MAG: hypothetical protein IJL87_06205 [Clostridia bacterium]|nr:hypothetical protein [Clostridia bacterium]